MPGSTQPQRMGWTPSRAMSAPVSITTPSGARIAEMRACACGERTIAQ